MRGSARPLAKTRLPFVERVTMYGTEHDPIVRLTETYALCKCGRHSVRTSYAVIYRQPVNDRAVMVDPRDKDLN